LLFSIFINASKPTNGSFILDNFAIIPNTKMMHTHIKHIVMTTVFNIFFK
jgi:hypothetical protein